MAVANQLKPAENARVTEPSQPSARPTSGLKGIFVGPNGLRTSWRLLIFVMGKIEHRKFSEYGLPLRQALGKDFWRGCLWGFLAISGTLPTMFLLHGFRVAGLALHGGQCRPRSWRGA